MAKNNVSHEPIAIANAFAATVAAVFVVCRVAFAIAPDLTMEIAKSWFHGIDISRIAAQNVGTDTFILGLVSAVVSAWLAGYLFAVLYNAFAKK